MTLLVLYLLLQWCGRDLGELQAMIDVPLCVYFRCYHWRLMVWWRCVETWVIMFGHSSFFHPDVVFFYVFHIEDIFVRDDV